MQESIALVPCRLRAIAFAGILPHPASVCQCRSALLSLPTLAGDWWRHGPPPARLAAGQQVGHAR